MGFKHTVMVTETSARAGGGLYALVGPNMISPTVPDHAQGIWGLCECQPQVGTAVGNTLTGHGANGRPQWTLGPQRGGGGVVDFHPFPS